MRLLSSFRNHFRPEDAAAILYFIALSVILLVYHSGLELWGLYILAQFLVIFAIVALVNISTRPIIGLTFLRDWYPVVIFFFAFEEMNDLIHIIKPDWMNETLIDWDFQIFGVHPTVWFEQYMTPWLTEYMEFAYFAYYLLIPIPARNSGVKFNKNNGEALSGLSNGAI